MNTTAPHFTGTADSTRAAAPARTAEAFRTGAAFRTTDAFRTAATNPFTERYGRRLPRGFAEEAAGMDWRTMVDTFAPSTDHFHLADLTRRPLGRGITAYEAILATRTPEDQPGRFTANRLTTESCGDLTAMSEMLGCVGAPAEIERFHQYDSHQCQGTAFEGTQSWCTILRATCGRRERWAMGFGQDSSEASIAALLNAATRLHLR